MLSLLGPKGQQMRPLLHLGLLLEIEPLLCLGPNGITDGTFQLLHLHLLHMGD